MIAYIPLIVAIINAVIQAIKFIEAHPEVGESLHHILGARADLESASERLTQYAMDQRKDEVQGA